jgi:hypothetical protein
MPIAHADVDRQRMAQSREPLLEPAGLTPGDLSDRRDAAEQLVMVCNLLDALGAHASPAEHVGEEWTDIGRTLRTAERDNEDRIEAQNRSLLRSVLYPWRNAVIQRSGA